MVLNPATAEFIIFDLSLIFFIYVDMWIQDIFRKTSGDISSMRYPVHKYYIRK